MKAKLTFWERFRVFFGLEFVVNLNTKEVHYLRHKHRNCRTHLMSRRNKRYVPMHEAFNLMLNKYNGCRYCWPQEDIDMDNKL